ncbi:MAG: HEPN domain-containing protein [Planctomycetota bacterium]|jgi:HEPN domain-containing protein/predicted nucleotidyltransferase
MPPEMKTDLSHLPEDDQEALRNIAGCIREAVTAEMIILFGSYARGDWVVDRYVEDGVIYEYISDYDILVVVPPPGDGDEGDAHKRDAKVEIRIKEALPKGSRAKAIVHDIKFLNSRLEEGHYFFTDIVKEGVLLHDSGNFELAKARDISNERRKRIAEEDFEQWFESASQFLHDSIADAEKGWLKKAAFELHQATERFYTAILLVHTGYRPKTHDLGKLDARAAPHVPDVIRVFPRATPEEQERFERLNKAYVGARYKKTYEITRDDLEYLAGRVRELRSLTESACRARIAGFDAE